MKDLASKIWIRITGVLSFTGICLGTPADGALRKPANPVLLVHGIHDSAASMRVMGQWLKRRGWEVYDLSLTPNDGKAPLEELAGQVDAFVSTTFLRGRKFDIVAFSMGGIVCRYYLQRMSGVRRVDRFVQISSPNHGTWMASLISHPGCVQMRRRSQFLENLNADLLELTQVQFTTIWTPFDLMILPARSSVMPIGRNVRVWVLAHPLMVLQPAVFRLIADALGQKLQSDP